MKNINIEYVEGFIDAVVTNMQYNYSKTDLKEVMKCLKIEKGYKCVNISFEANVIVDGDHQDTLTETKSSKVISFHEKIDKHCILTELEHEIDNFIDVLKIAI